jgi:predicted porin
MKGSKMLKKNLIAAGILAVTVTGIAQAQVSVSPVQIYGILGTGVSKVTSAGDSTSSQVNKDRLDTSVLGIRGAEDLGNGLSAEFEFQGNILAESGKLGSMGNSTAANNTLFDRQAWVGLNKKGMGSIKVGRTGVIHDSYTGVANFGFNLLDQDGDTTGLSKKPENTVRVDSVAFGGLKVMASYSADGSYLDSITKEIKSYGAEYQLGTVALHAVQTKSGIITNNMVGFKTMVGKVDLRGQYLNSDDGAGIKLGMYKVGAALPVTERNTIYTQYTKRDRNASNTGDFDFYGTALVHSLSKRTDLWAGYASKNFKDATADSKEYTAGIQHKF